jgi:anti-sigma factor RsiW
MNTQDSSIPTSPCDELSELLPAYAAGALIPEEVEHVKTLLEKCPQMQAEVAEYRTLMTGFYDRVEPVSPPADLHERLMKKVRANTSVEPSRNGKDLEEKHQELFVVLQTDIGEDHTS